MQHTALGNSGLRVSQIGLGTVQFGLDYGFTKRKTQAEVDAILSCAVELGINYLDTARAYGDSEEKIGRFLAGSPGWLMVATKLDKITEAQAGVSSVLYDCMMASVEASLRTLNLDRIPMLQIHQADPFLVLNATFWKQVSRIKEAGYIKAFGVSVYEVTEAASVVEHGAGVVDFLQVPYNVFDRRFEQLKALIQERGVGVIGRSTFLKGVIPCKVEDLPAELAGLLPHKAGLSCIAGQTGLGMDELALLYVLKKGFIQSTILGVDSAEELRRNVGILSKADQLEHLDEVDKLAVTQEQLIDPRRWRSL